MWHIDRSSDPNFVRVGDLRIYITLSPTPNLKSIDIKLCLWRWVEVSCFSTTIRRTPLTRAAGLPVIAITLERGSCVNISKNNQFLNFNEYLTICAVASHFTVGRISDCTSTTSCLLHACICMLVLHGNEIYVACISN